MIIKRDSITAASNSVNVASLERAFNKASGFLDKLGKWLAKGADEDDPSDDKKFILEMKVGDLDIVDSEDEDIENVEYAEGSYKTVRALVTITGGVEDDYCVFDIAVKYKDDPDSTAKVKKGVKFDYTSEKDYNKKLQAAIDKELTDLIGKLTDGKYTGYEDLEFVEASVKVAFNKITASTDTSVDLIAIDSDYGVNLTSELLDTVINDDTFIDSLPEGESSYSLVPDDDAVEIEVYQDDIVVDPYASIFAILEPLYVIQTAAQCISWNVYGKDADALARKCEDIQWDTRSSIDQLSNLCARLSGHAPNPTEFFSAITSKFSPDCINFDLKSGCDILKPYIDDVVRTIEVFYPNFQHEDQVMLDNMLASWKNRQYFMLREGCQCL